MFNKIIIDGFRSLNHIEIEDLKQFNLIIGKNNCGKTNILEAFYLSINPGNPTLASRINEWRRFDVINPESWKSLFYKFEINSSITIETVLTKPYERRLLKIKPIIKTGIIDLSNESKDDSLFSPILGLDYELEVEDLNTNISNHYSTNITIKKDFLNIPKEPLLGKYIEPFDIKFPENYNCPTNGKLMNQRTILYDLLEKFGKIVKTRQKDVLINHLNKIDSNIKDMEIAGNKIHIDYGYKELIPIDMIGEGILRFLALDLDILLEKKSILLIDEIENGLHYSALEKLWKLFFQIAKENDIQVIASTHSYDCIKAFKNAMLNSDDHRDECRVYRIERYTDDNYDNYKVLKYDYINLKNAIDQDWEIR